jgi:hypothetical protein
MSAPLIEPPNRAQSASDADGLHGARRDHFMPLDLDRIAANAGDALQEGHLDLVCAVRGIGILPASIQREDPMDNGKEHGTNQERE